MQQNAPNYRREERNGKVIYVKHDKAQPSRDPGAQFIDSKGLDSKPLESKDLETPLVKHIGATESLSQEKAYSPRKSLPFGPLPSQANIKQPQPQKISFFCRVVIGVWLPVSFCLGSGMITITLAWLSWEVLSNPDMTFWVNQFAPGGLNDRIPGQNQPKPLADILQRLKQGTQLPGEPIQLSSGPPTQLNQTNGNQANQVAIPILRNQADPNCQSHCQSISEIQVYRSLQLPRLVSWFQREKRFRLVDRMVVVGPSEQDLRRLISTINRTDLSGGASRPLPMSNIDLLNRSDRDEISNRDDVWLMLSGLEAQGNATAAYGQLLYFSQRSSHLSLMVDWLSPSGSFPRWQNLTGNDVPEIIIDQSIGLEPAFLVYQLKQAPSGGTLAYPIQLSPPAIDLAPYRDGLNLAKNGLWEAAFTHLAQLKQNAKLAWNAQAQAQFDLIKLHANFVQAQAKQTSASGVEQIQILLLNGSWTLAKDLLLQHPDQIPELKILIANEKNTIRDRLLSSIEVDGKNSPALDWQVIIQYLETGPKSATNWINKQPFSTDRKTALVNLIKTIDRAEKSLRKKASEK